MGNGRGRGGLAIGIVVRLDDTAGGVEVDEAALIGTIERSRTLFDDESLL